MSFEIIHGDITEMKTDAIVNAANSQLMRGGGVCGAIFARAASKELQAECDRLAPCPTGQAVVTKGYALPAKYIVHTVGPVWRGGTDGEEQLLHDAYVNALKTAAKKGCRSIAFPLISSGIYGYPREEAMSVAKSAIEEFLTDNSMEVYLVLL